MSIENFSEIGEEKTAFDAVYICGAATVSPQASFDQMLTQPAFYQGDRFFCIEPDYTQYVAAKLIRRMSRIIKMGVAAATEALKQAQLQQPDAIITGTAYGCLADTEAFLTRLVTFKEELLSPTAFIQSTHNTVGAQIALLLGCHKYNNTYVHRGSSFEAALLDALSLLQEGEAHHVLVGAADEIVEKSHAIIRRLGAYKKEGDSATLFQTRTKGTMAGEGAAFFVLSKEKQDTSLARLHYGHLFHKSTHDIASSISDFLAATHTSLQAIDVVIMGNNGDATTDAHYYALAQKLFTGKKLVGYKNYCGEYPTSAAFALWMATKMMEHGRQVNNETSPRNILIYNNYTLRYPSLYLLSAV